MLELQENKIIKYIEELNKRAKEALNKKSAYGIDLDITKFKMYSLLEKKVESFHELDSKILEKSEEVGFSTSEENKSGSYFQIDSNPIYTRSKVKGLEIYSFEEALNIEEVRSKIWSSVPVDQDKFTALAQLLGKGGYVIIVREGTKVEEPVQSCLFISNVEIQAPHNIIIAEDNSSVNIVTGCTIMPESVGLHAGISEFFVGKNAKVNFIMIHSWNRKTHVRPRTAAIVDEGGEFTYYYVNLKPVFSFQSYPKVVLKGESSMAYMSSTVLASENADIDIGGEIVFEGKNSKGEVISKSIAKDSSKIVARAKLVANAKNSKGHIECNGLILSPSSKIYAVPELEGNLNDVELTHEASIGKIAEDEIIYLMSKGFSREEAISILIKGFVTTKTVGLPPYLEKTLHYLDEQILRLSKF